MKQHAENPINNSTYKADLDHDQRALASKLIKILKKMLFKNRIEVENSLTNANIANEYKKYLIKIFDNFHYHRTINNYSLINFHLNQEQADVNDYTYLLEKKTKNFGNRNDIKFSNLEWKIEVTLSSIWMKKVIILFFFFIFKLCLQNFSNFIRKMISFVHKKLIFFQILRPMILMVWTTKDGLKKSFYIDVTMFQELRKNFALILRNIHQIELKA